MTFARQLGTAVLVGTLTLCIQCAGIAVLIRLARASIERGVARRSAVHAAILSSPWESSVYFSVTSYSTVGYGDIVLPRVWRLLGPVKSVTGVLMCGMPVCFLFVAATKLVERESGAPPDAICKRFGRTFRSGAGKPLLRTARSKSMTDCQLEERSDENLQFGLQASEPI